MRPAAGQSHGRPDEQAGSSGARDLRGPGSCAYFLSIYGGNSLQPRSQSGGLLALMSEAGAKPEETVMIGDSQVDVETARNAGAWCIGCTFALRPEPGRQSSGCNRRFSGRLDCRAEPGDPGLEGDPGGA